MERPAVACGYVGNVGHQVFDRHLDQTLDQSLRREEGVHVVIVAAGSTDGTGDAVRRVNQVGESPPGWLGKPWARQSLGVVSLIRGSQMQLVSPHPKQSAHGIAECITQPLANWTWIATLPLRLPERSWPILTADMKSLMKGKEGPNTFRQWSLHLRDRARGPCVHGSTVRHRSGTHLALGFFG